MEKIALTTAGERHIIALNINGVWESNALTESKNTIRSLKIFSNSDYDKDINPSCCVVSRISTLLWGLNFNLIRPDEVRIVNKILSARQVKHVWTLNKYVHNPDIAELLLWYLWYCPKQHSVVNPQTQWKELSSAVMCKYPFDDLWYSERLHQLNRYYSPKNIRPADYSAIFDTLKDVTHHNSRCKYNSHNSSEREHKNQSLMLDGTWEFRLALTWYETACTSGVGTNVLPNFVRVFNGVDILRNNQPSYVPVPMPMLRTDYSYSDTCINDLERMMSNSKNKLDVVDTIHQARILYRNFIGSTGTTYAYGTDYFYPPVWRTAISLMCRSLLLSANADDDPLSVDHAGLYPTPASIIAAANPNEPGFWRLLIALKWAQIIFQIVYDHRFKGDREFQRRQNQKMSKAVEATRGRDMSHLVSTQKIDATNNQLLLELRAEAERLGIKVS